MPVLGRGDRSARASRQFADSLVTVGSVTLLLFGVTHNYFVIRVISLGHRVMMLSTVRVAAAELPARGVEWMCEPERHCLRTLSVGRVSFALV